MEARRSSPWLLPMLAILLVVGVVAPLAVVMSPYGGGYYGMMGGGAGWGMAMMLVPLVVLVLLLLAFAGALSLHGLPAAYVPATTAPILAGSAREILDARYARGEISQDEYLRIRADLTGGGGKPA